MSDYTAIRDAVLSVRDLLRRHITDTTELGLHGVPIDLRGPRELELSNVDSAVSLWLHRVESQPDLLNRPPPRSDASHEFHTQTPVELCLHVTPINSDAGTRLLLTGRIAQVFTDHRRLSGADLVGSLTSSTTTLQLGMDQLGAYQLYQLWSSQQTYQRLGIGLRVEGVVIDSHLPPMSSARVLAAATSVDEIVRSSV